VRSTLSGIGSDGVPELLVLNKVDTAAPQAVRRLAARHPDAVAVSAVTGEGIDRLVGEIDNRLQRESVDLEVLIPYDRGDLPAALHRVGEVLSESHEADGVRITARVPVADAAPFRPYAG
jgi:GTP-binding protein HflX